MKAEFAAFKARLESSPILAGKVYPIVRKTTDGSTVRDNYVVARSSKPDRVTDARFTGVDTFDSDRRYTYNVRVVAVDAGGLDVLGEAAARTMLGATLTVAGRSCTPIELVPDVEDGDGYDRTADLYYRDFGFRFWSRRA
jgi:hypothetical protein